MKTKITYINSNAEWKISDESIINLEKYCPIVKVIQKILEDHKLYDKMEITYNFDSESVESDSNAIFSAIPVKKIALMERSLGIYIYENGFRIAALPGAYPNTLNCYKEFIEFSDPEFISKFTMFVSQFYPFYRDYHRWQEINS